MMPFVCAMGICFAVTRAPDVPVQQLGFLCRWLLLCKATRRRRDE